MSSEENKAVVHRLFSEVMGKGNMDVADEVLAEDYVDHSLPAPGVPGTREGLKQLVMGVRHAFPDVEPVIEETIAEGDRVAARVKASATHENEFMGVPATGKEVSWKEIHIYRIAEGEIAEHWGVFDMMGLMQQLGAVPPPGGGGG